MGSRLGFEDHYVQVLDSYTDLQNVYERKNKELESVRAKFDERKKNLAVVRKVELETKAHIDELSKTIAKHQAASAEVTEFFLYSFGFSRLDSFRNVSTMYR